MPQRHYNRNNMGTSRPRRTSRPQPGRQGGFGGFSGRRQNRGFTGENININRFINRSVGVHPSEEYVSKNSFADFAIHPRLKSTIAACKFANPTPIQDMAIQPILEGRDLIGLADTGTGKTGAFLIPMIHKLLSNSNERLLVIAPTRELAIQIQQDFLSLARGLRLSSVVIVGGANIRNQISQLRWRQNIVIGTPGRLKDLIGRKNLGLSGFRNVVLDEADRMLDMGFINDIKFLLSLMAHERQTLFFSATLSQKILELSQMFLKNPVNISIKKQETSANVNQDIVRIGDGSSKGEILHDLLRKDEFQKVLIFTRTKHGADKLKKILFHKGFIAESIHGNKTHSGRQKALKLFKDNTVQILIATDVAARGLDIPNVSHVINYDIPATYDDYIHRIGRTGRAGKLGNALTFVP